MFSHARYVGLALLRLTSSSGNSKVNHWSRFPTLFLFLCGSAHGALHDRGGGFIYDDVQDLTWVQNVTLSPPANWANQVAWALNLSIADTVRNVTWSDWRLPNANVDGDSFVSRCLLSDTEPCIDNELAYMSSGAGYNIHKSNPGPFTGFVDTPTAMFSFWTGTQSAIDQTYAWGWSGFPGIGMSAFDKTLEVLGWAVRDGDVGSIPPISVVIDIKPGAVPNTIHTNHNNVNVSPFLDDLIQVGVLGAMTSVGDPVNFNTSTIDPATLKFGPGAGSIAPGTTPLFNQNVDNDGIADAKFEFRTSASGIACGQTSATLTGKMTGGQAFTGTDTIATQCNANCH